MKYTKILCNKFTIKNICNYLYKRQVCVEFVV